jgi:alkylation response protein AidB-like acyl-CoA dehydrogenase
MQGVHFLNGRKIVVYGAPEADMLFVTARTAGRTRDEHGISLFLVGKDAPGVSLRPYVTADGMSAADIVFEQVRIPASSLVGERDEALPLVQQVVDEATAAVCAEAVGAIEALNQRCVEHCKTREAFGKPLSKFQVLQHRLVDMRVSYEQAAAIVLKASLAVTLPAPARARAVSACKVQVCQEAAFVGKNALQLHGAMGITDELDVGHYFKRLTLIQSMFGSVDHHLRRYLRLSGNSAEGATRHGN